MPGFKKRSRPTTLRAPTTSAASPPASPPSSNDEGNVVTGASTSTTSTAKKARGAPLVHQFTSDTTAGRDNKTFATLETETSSSGDQRTRLEANLTSTLGATTNDDTGLYTGANNYKAIIPKSFDSIRGAKGNGNSGPLRANTTIRVTSRFDYQPDVCKDYKDTGFCGFGDTCIFMHDRGGDPKMDQMEDEWAAKKKAREDEQERVLAVMCKEVAGEEEEEAYQMDRSFPFSCHICRLHFTDPTLTTCGHYFCSACIHKAYKKSQACPVCKKDLGGVFKQPVKIIKELKKLQCDTFLEYKMRREAAADAADDAKGDN